MVIQGDQPVLECVTLVIDDKQMLITDSKTLVAPPRAQNFLNFSAVFNEIL